MLADVYAASTVAVVSTHPVVHEVPRSSETWRVHAKYTCLKSQIKCINYTLRRYAIQHYYLQDRLISFGFILPLFQFQTRQFIKFSP